jgi:regulator of sigma E protease
MAGETVEDQQSQPTPKPDEFNAKPIPQRAAVAIAGPAFNYVSAVLFLWIALIIGFEQPRYLQRAVVGDVVAGSAAQQAGFKAGDSLVAIGKQKISQWEDVGEAFSQLEQLYQVSIIRDGQLQTLELPGPTAKGNRPLDTPTSGLLPAPPAVIGVVEDGSAAHVAGLMSGDSVVQIQDSIVYSWFQVVSLISSYDSSSGPLAMTVMRQGAPQQLQVKPTYDGSTKRFRIGIGMAEPQTYAQKWGAAEAIPQAFKRSRDIIANIFTVLSKLFSRQLSPEHLAGPIGIVQMSGNVAFMGFSAMLSFMALISINLALINLLPLVITDGGQLLFMLIEAVRGKPLALKYQYMINRIAIAFFIFLFLYVTFNDVRRFPSFFR